MKLAEGDGTMIYQNDDADAELLTLDAEASHMPPQVLVVDDSKEIRDVIVWMLRISGYRALAAENGFAAQLLLTAMQPTLIVSDLKMPLCDGWDLLAFCHEHYPEIPVLIVSGQGLGNHPEIERWAAGYIAKPFDSHEFCNAVDRLMERTVKT